MDDDGLSRNRLELVVAKEGWGIAILRKYAL